MPLQRILFLMINSWGLAPAQCCEKQQRRRVNAGALWGDDISIDSERRARRSFLFFLRFFVADFPRRGNRNCLARWKTSEVIHWIGILCTYSLHSVWLFSSGNSGSRL
jgi:hypothetical protein